MTRGKKKKKKLAVGITLKKNEIRLPIQASDGQILYNIRVIIVIQNFIRDFT